MKKIFNLSTNFWIAPRINRFSIFCCTFLRLLVCQGVTTSYCKGMFYKKVICKNVVSKGCCKEVHYDLVSKRSGVTENLNFYNDVKVSNTLIWKDCGGDAQTSRRAALSEFSLFTSPSVSFKGFFLR